MYSNISFLLLRNKLPIIVDLQVTNRNLENSVAQSFANYKYIFTTYKIAIIVEYFKEYD